MSWGKLKDIKGAQIVRILNEFSDYVRNIICIHVVAVVFERIRGARTLTKFGCGRSLQQLRYSMLYL